MIDVIESKREEILALCREFEVQRLEVFGSVVSGEFDPDRSDIDFLVDYPEGYDFGPWGERYLDLKQRLEAVLGRQVDLVANQSLRNPYLIRSIESTRRLLYAA